MFYLVLGIWFEDGLPPFDNDKVMLAMCIEQNLHLMVHVHFYIHNIVINHFVGAEESIITNLER